MYFENPKTEDFPERIDHPPLRMIMSKEYYKKYREVETKKSSLWKDSNPWIFLTGVRVATNALEPCQKCEWTINKIKEGEKTLVYSAFLTYGVKKLQEMLKNTGIKFEEVIGSMSPKERAKAVRKYNKGAKNGGVNVLFITKAGGEGLDLKGTRNVILLEKSWNKPQEEQIIGRAVRYKSHSDLPKDQQKVDVYHLLISKPANGRDVDDDKRESADDILNELTEDKEAANKMFQKLLRSVSIDAPKGSVCPPVDYIKINSPKTKKKQGNKIKMTVTIFDKRKFFGRKKLHENEKIKEKLKNIILKSDKNVNPDEDIIYKTELLPGFTEEDRIKMGTGAITQNIIKFTMYGTKKSISAITKRIVKLIAGSSTLKNYFNEDWKNDNTLEYTIEFAHHHGISPKKIILSKSPIKIISPKKAPKSFTKTYSKSSEKSPIEMELEYPKKGNKTKMFVTIYDERPYLMNIPPSARGEHAARKFLDKKMIEQIKDIILKSDKKVNVDEDIDYEEELSQNVIGFTMYGTKNTTQDVTMKIGKLIAGFRGISNFDWENKNTLVYTIK
jgi:superfamily II DNA/RNA helicase